ncbi:MAG: DeoR/GlpR transcriptional regulator [Ruminococcaceae bacterium]|nr:DeoR/GlpR transcriptional regulator [Oscillospiraceae bacterium]
MLQLERQKDILRLLQAKKSMTVKELCAALYASPATVRRDLCALEQSGLLTRSFGGAVLNEVFPDQQPFAVRSGEHIVEKKRVAAKAAAFLHAGETIFLDASSTTYYLAPHLRDLPDLTVVTNSPRTCLALAENGVRCFCTGGELLEGSLALVGSDAERFVRGIRAHVAFFSARGVADGQITDSSKGERDLKIAMLEHAGRSVFLFDRSKEGKVYPHIVTDLSHVDEIVGE